MISLRRAVLARPFWALLPFWPLWPLAFCALSLGTACAQELHGQRGVFEGITGDRMTVHLSGGDATWTLDPRSHFANGRPVAGDWVHVEVDAYGRAQDILIEESPVRVYATVDHTEGAMVVARTNSGVEMWNDVPATWHLGVAPGGLLPGDAVDVGVLRNRELAYVRLNSRASAGPAPGAPVQQVGEVLEAPEAPPPLPAYDVPPCPEPDALWTPGYWHWGRAGYYWVPGVWLMPPAPGLLWTPGYWEFVGSVYRFHAGYWGPHVGFYGGVAYGGGYYGEGFVGARWEGGHVAYNTAALRVNSTVIHNTYVNETIVVNHQTTSISNFNASRPERMPAHLGGEAGINARPSESERRWAGESRVQPTPVQVQHVQAANETPQLQRQVNQGRPPVLAAERPLTPPHAETPRFEAPREGGRGREERR